MTTKTLYGQTLNKVNMPKSRPILFLTVLVLFLISCDQKPKNPVDEYGTSLIDSYKKAQKAGESANLDAVKKSVQAYRAANDKYPDSLDEIKGFINSDIDLSKYDYNPENGAVSIKK
jgi:competence protein ComGC